jgi:universal stress protein E
LARIFEKSSVCDDDASSIERGTEAMNMDKLTSILVVADRSSHDQALLAKAIVLARSVGARIHLFSCDADLAYSLRHSYDQADVEKAWNTCVADRHKYLEALCASAQASDLDISVDSTCDSPLHEAIVKKVLAYRPDLVMKTASGAHPLRRISLDSNDWQLMRACPVTLMLIRGKPWAAPPRFAAMVDVSQDETPQLAEAIVHTAEYFALGCGGELDLAFSEWQEAGERHSRHVAALEQLARVYRIETSHVHVLSGDPDIALPRFAAQRGYDALVLGALTHRHGLAALVGTLTGKLVDDLDCDFILVKRAAHISLNSQVESLESDSPVAGRNVPEAMVTQPLVSRVAKLCQGLFGS